MTMHRFILNYSGEDDVDHINKNKFDNRKANLRIVPHVVNSANNKGKGIYKYGKKYHVIFNRYGRKYNVGYFETLEEAEKARDKKIEDIETNKESLVKDYLENRKSYTKGIYLSENNKWIAGVCFNGSCVYVGTFENKEEAILARENKLRELQAKKMAAS